MFPWTENWVIVAANEILSMLFLYHIGVNFNPLQEQFLLRAFDGSGNRPRTD
jgi:hypothetical protein